MQALATSAVFLPHETISMLDQKASFVIDAMVDIISKEEANNHLHGIPSGVRANTEVFANVKTSSVATRTIRPDSIRKDPKVNEKIGQLNSFKLAAYCYLRDKVITLLLSRPDTLSGEVLMCESDYNREWIKSPQARQAALLNSGVVKSFSYAIATKLSDFQKPSL